MSFTPVQPHTSGQPHRTPPSLATGLRSDEVRSRMEQGLHNAQLTGITPSVGMIILKNTLTLFNIINLGLAIAILLVGHPKNALFLGVAICNTLMGIVQELRAKRTLDKLSILARGTARVLRDGQWCSIPQEQIVLDDILLLSAGEQVPADGTILQCEGLEVNESLLTGEADNIRKEDGQVVLSGSFVTAGQAAIHVTAVGAASYAGALTAAAKKEHRPRTPLMRTLNNIIKVLAIAIIPLGLLLFYTQYSTSANLPESVLGASAAMIGMIPEGLVLLTGVTLTLGAVKLARRKALVQSLPSIETLARADVLCLDKTGTITDGTLSFEETVPLGDFSAEDTAAAMGELMAATKDDNATATALRAAFSAQSSWPVQSSVPFSSARKWSAVTFAEKGTYVLGAPGFVLPRQAATYQKQIQAYAEKGQRVLCLAHTNSPLPQAQLPPDITPLALLILSDTIRPEAPDTFRFFENEGVTLKVISGDDALTVSTIAQKAGISGAERYIDLSTASGQEIDYKFITERYTVFGRVLPEQKKALIAAMKENGHTTCMTGDGVNDVLAMKEADCSIAMIGGSSAARGASNFILMTSNFAAMIDVLREGRRVINNIENVASMYLVKTIYSTILAFLYVFIPHPYPFAPLQMTPINALTVGVPSFFLALRANYEKPKGRFLWNILQRSLPGALCVVGSVLFFLLAGLCFGLTQEETSTMNVLLTGAVSFCVLYQVAQPLSWKDKLLIALLILSFLLIFIFFGWFFMLETLFTRNVFFYLPLLFIMPQAYHVLSGWVGRYQTWWTQRHNLQA